MPGDLWGLSPLNPPFHGVGDCQSRTLEELSVKRLQEVLTKKQRRGSLLASGRKLSRVPVTQAFALAGAQCIKIGVANATGDFTKFQDVGNDTLFRLKNVRG